MNEAAWNRCTDPTEMLAFLRDRGRLSERKARLFAVAVCRDIWPLLTDERSRRAVEVAERYADHLVDQGELAEACQEAAGVCGGVADSWEADPDPFSPDFTTSFEAPADAAAYAATWACVRLASFRPVE
jgi:hypothetical protein